MTEVIVADSSDIQYKFDYEYAYPHPWTFDMNNAFIDVRVEAIKCKTVDIALSPSLKTHKRKLMEVVADSKSLMLVRIPHPYQ